MNEQRTVQIIELIEDIDWYRSLSATCGEIGKKFGKVHVDWPPKYDQRDAEIGKNTKFISVQQVLKVSDSKTSQCWKYS